MKKTFILLLALFAMTANTMAGDTLSLKQITDRSLTPKRVAGVIPIKGSSEYASIEDEGRRIVTYSFKTGRQTGVLFDVSQTEGEHIEAIDGYDVSADGRRLLIETNTQAIYRRSYTADCYIYDTQTRRLSKLSERGGEQIATFSPDGKRVAYVRANNIYMAEDGQERQLTTDGKPNHIINGLPDWVNEEEFAFNNALAWDADGQTLSYIRYDESRVPTYDLQMFHGSHPDKAEYADYPGLYSYKYPKAGQPNAKVSVHTVSLSDGKTLRYDLPLDSDGYVPRIRTASQAGRIIIFTQNRHQDCLRLYAADTHTGRCTLLIEDKDSRYVREEALEGTIMTDRHILLPSERDGHMGLYLYDLNGRLLRQLTRPGEEVEEVYGYDERGGWAYYLAVGKTPMDRVVRRTNGTKTQDLTSDTGFVSASFSGDYKFFLANQSDLNHPSSYTIYDNSGNTVREVLDNKAFEQSLNAYQLAPREFFSFTTSEDVTLNGWLVKPADFDSTRTYPVILYQYSGPGSQQVLNSWNAGSMGNGGLFDHYLAQHGYVVACVDGRGTGGRGADFEKQTYLRLGELESRDQVEAALWLGSQPWVDASRIGIWGWSYGGFNTLMSMSEGRAVFKAGVAVAPPTNWKFYDTIYTERYMRTPQENPDGYAINPIGRAEKLHGALLICHGLADDNVHPQNTFEYTEALVQADKDFHMNIYTNRNHSIYGGNTRHHLLRQIARWFMEKL